MSKSILLAVCLTSTLSFAQEGSIPSPRAWQPEMEESHAFVPARSAPASPRELAAPAVLLSHRGDDRLHFDVDAHGTVWVRGRTYKASFSSSAATYVPFLGSDAPRNFPLALQAESVTVAGSPLAFDASAPAVRDGDVIEYDRGAFRERYLLALDSIEQTFVFDALPMRGALVVTIGVESELQATEFDAGFRFGNDLGGVQYGRAFAYDAKHAAEPIESRLSVGRIEITAPAALVARSTGAFVIDPVLTTFSLADSILDELNADTAFDSTNGIWLSVYEQVFSASDHDILAERHSTSGVNTAFDYVDATGDTWRTPAVANNNIDDQFLVVAAVGNAPNREIWARTVEATVGMNLSAQFQLGTNFAETRDMYAPDVGGNAATSGTNYYCVVWEREYVAGTDYNIAAALVRTDTVEAALFFVDNSAGTIHRNPSISNSSGNAVASLRDWNIVWEEEVTPANHDILGARFHYDGYLTAPTFTVASSVLDERNPSVTAIVDDFGAVRPWMAAWQIDSGANGWDIRCRTFDDTSSLSTFDLSEQFPTVGLDQVTPSCDTALGEFVVVWDERPGPIFTSTDIRVATLYSLGGVLGVNEGDLSVAPGMNTDLRPRVATMGSAGSTGDDALVVFDRDDGGPNDVMATGYDLPNGGPVTPICSGDGSGTACPCGNNGLQDRGCASSVNAMGGRLAGPGIARVSNDTFQLVATGLPDTTTALFFQGTAQVAAGNGAVFGDGLRCAAGTVIRLATRTAAGGLVYYPTVGGDPDISVKGLIPATGALRYYQAWYRNSAAFCTAATFNLTNGLRVQWIP